MGLCIRNGVEELRDERGRMRQQFAGAVGASFAPRYLNVVEYALTFERCGIQYAPPDRFQAAAARQSGFRLQAHKHTSQSYLIDL
jgi:hypothetical protein